MINECIVLNFNLFLTVLFTAAIFGEQQQKHIQSSIFVCNNPRITAMFPEDGKTQL